MANDEPVSMAHLGLHQIAQLGFLLCANPLIRF